jgi:LAO/AO transport system kinase
MALKARLSTEEYVTGIAAGDRVILAKAITLVESNLANDRTQAAELFEKIISKAGNSVRIGITGVPGVGKSTLIESFGKYITGLGKKIAVLTVDPSSQLTKGSILGDKTRMETLSKNPQAFIRPSASGSTLGGVANSTREAMLLCEAAGYDVILIETVGVGQSEVAVKNMVDFFLLLMLAGAGDELQGIKKGIMEMADSIVITKADGENVRNASEAQAEYQHALHLFPPSESGWITKVLTCSAHTNSGIEEMWKVIDQYKNQTQASGYFTENRKQQSIAWLHEYFDSLLKREIQRFPLLQREKEKLESEVANQKLSPQAAAIQLLNAYHKAIAKA